MGQGHVGAGQRSASELILYSDYPRIALHLAGPNGGQSAYSSSTVAVHTELRSDLEEISSRRRSQWLDSGSAIVRNWFGFGHAIVWLVFGCASAVSRSIAEGFSKASRTLVEARSKDCRTSLEQQSNNGRRNIEESCVCTHAKVPARSGLGLALGVVVLFSLSMMSNLSAQINKDAVLVHQNSRASFTDRLVDQTAQQLEQDLRGLVIGDKLPESFWDLRLKVVNHPEGTDSITLRDYKGSKLLVLDFWATWCKPCVISVDKWEKKLDSIPEMSFVPVHMDFEEKALPFILKRGWKSPSVVGEERKLLNKLFFKEPRITRSVWILDGRFVAVTGYNGPDATTILDVIHSGRSIPSLTESLYSPLY